MNDALKLKKTRDGSFTFHSTDYDESYHSVNGALNEAFFKFAFPCRVDVLAKSGDVRILDIGFGLGYNALSAIYTARNTNPDCSIDVVSLEKDPISVSTLDLITLPERYIDDYSIIKSAAKDFLYDENKIRIEILTGDARETIRTLDSLFDAVFLDPFSVRKNVELWTVDFFREIYKRMIDKAILATYSASTPVRCGLKEAGFKIGPGPGDGMKKAGTLATKCADIEEFSEKDKKRIRNSPEREPFRDPDLNMTQDEIFKGRQA